MPLQRNEKGHFLESKDGLHPKPLCYRLPRAKYPKFQAIAALADKSLSELTREIVLQYIQEFENKQTKS